jgi:hypothetical protein
MDGCLMRVYVASKAKHFLWCGVRCVLLGTGAYGGFIFADEFASRRRQ